MKKIENVKKPKPVVQSMPKPMPKPMPVPKPQPKPMSQPILGARNLGERVVGNRASTRLSTIANRTPSKHKK
ncbi:MAG: hypothetical protein DDT31_01422 [Syntrophomonadaceae bacterium]|nr:hypothetical protein [Bacillota bacterium]